jgi:FkbM family methyltransferase
MNVSNKIKALRDNLQFDNWAVAVLQRLLFRKEHLIVYRKGGVTLLVDFAGGDQCGTRECLASDMYSRYFLHLPKDHPLTVLDLGANGGGFPLSLMAAGFAIAKSVSVEMNPNTFTRLQFNLNYNSRRRCLAINAAVAARNGWAAIADTPGGTSESLYSKVYGSENERVKVPLMTFDEIVTAHFGNTSNEKIDICTNEKIDICKIDVEGAEYEVFQSETCQSIKRVRFLVIEIHKRPDALEIIGKIGSFGFVEVTDANPPNGEVHFFRNTRLVAGI